MLYEVYCDKFTTKKDGQFVPRGRIRLHEGLNTVLGDKAAQNSIGKSTFLLIIDFCFGGEDYINPKICKAKEKLLEVAAKRNPDLDDSEIAEDQTIIDVIDKERKLELVQEGHRFFDARRLGKIISVADGAYTNFNIAKFVYPIPSFEVNSGFGVIQTEGWSDNLPR